LVVLDEATSAVDGPGAVELRRRLKEAFRGCTVLVIAHDPEAVRDADRILHLHEGAIIEGRSDGLPAAECSSPSTREAPRAESNEEKPPK
jgi:ABC-type bacteriocin/lantibiotic exporter with double-glycine peptidase domain